MTDAQARSQSSSFLRFATPFFASQKPLNHKLELTKLWVRLCRFHSLALCSLPLKICKSVDLQRMDRLSEQMADYEHRDPTSAAKYAEYEFWLPFNATRIGDLALHRSRPLRILDIGCGPGYFLAAARFCGHECYGVDVPSNIMSEVERRVYAELLGALSCEQYVSPLLIEHFVPMDLAVHDLDLITAFWICFNRHRRPDEWGIPEWQFFINDAMSHLSEHGVLHLELNSHPEKYQSLRWYDQELRDFFQSQGTVNHNVIRISKSSYLRQP